MCSFYVLTNKNACALCCLHILSMKADFQSAAMGLFLIFRMEYLTHCLLSIEKIGHRFKGSARRYMINTCTFKTHVKC